jgi:hypothetical protein
MWLRDTYIIPSWRYGSVRAMRAASASKSVRDGRFPEHQAAEIVRDLGRRPESRHDLLALCEGIIDGADRYGLARAPTNLLVTLVMKALTRGELIFLSDQVNAASIEQPGAVAQSLIERLMPQGRRLAFEGQVYRLVPAEWSGTSPGGEHVVPVDEARAALLRMKEKIARSNAEKDDWEKAASLVSDGKGQADTKPGTILLLRLREQSGAAEPAVPQPLAPRSVAPLVAPMPAQESEPEFTCPAEQAEALAAAARDGLPFCVECMCGEAARKAA